MAMVNLKSTSDELCMASPADDMAREYGYGTVISLDESQTKALGITAPPPFGTQMKIAAFATVVRTSVEDDGEGPEVYLRLQLTDMDLSAAQSDSSATSLYPNSSLL